LHAYILSFSHVRIRACGPFYGLESDRVLTNTKNRAPMGLRT
jgi:hypothetical protein